MNKFLDKLISSTISFLNKKLETNIPTLFTSNQTRFRDDSGWSDDEGSGGWSDDEGSDNIGWSDDEGSGGDGVVGSGGGVVCGVNGGVSVLGYWGRNESLFVTSGTNDVELGMLLGFEVSEGV